MSAAGSSSRAVFLVLAVCLIGSSSTYSQSPSITNAFGGLRAASNRTSSGAWLAKCAVLPTRALAGRPFSDEADWPAREVSMPADSNFAATPDLSCVERAFPTGLRAVGRVENPCRDSAAGASGAPQVFGCNGSGDRVSAELSSLGKPGVKIARAREQVLKILRSENGCTEWYETKARNPAETFQSVNFSLDPHGARDIFASIKDQATVVMRQPYVARATQGGGPYTTITINLNGAFYRPQGQVQKTAREGGPAQSGGTHVFTVGSYTGDALPAQMVTLLHEFGHIIGLLPEDGENLYGESVHNTDEVLRHCRAEILAQAKQFR
jgi:hypothetical protein